jgi:hypothetical protein
MKMLHKDEVKQMKNHFGSVKIGKFKFKGLGTYTDMSTFVKDIYNDNFEMLQTFYVKLMALYYSPCQVSGFF